MWSACLIRRGSCSPAISEDIPLPPPPLQPARLPLANQTAWTCNFSGQRKKYKVIIKQSEISELFHLKWTGFKRHISQKLCRRRFGRLKRTQNNSITVLFRSQRSWDIYDTHWIPAVVSREQCLWLTIFSFVFFFLSVYIDKTFQITESHSL